MYFKRIENFHFKNNSIILFDVPDNQNENELLEYTLQNLKDMIDFLLLKKITVFCAPVYTKSFTKTSDFSEAYFQFIFESLKHIYPIKVLNEVGSIKENFDYQSIYLVHPSLVNLQILSSMDFDSYVINSYHFLLYSPKDSFFSRLDKSKIILSSQIYEAIQILQQISSNKIKPKTCIMGGNQIKESIEFLNYTVKYFQNLLLGGSLGITALKANAIQVGNSPYSSEDLSPMFQVMSKAEFEECDVELPRDHIVTDKISNSSKFKTSPKEFSSSLISVDIGSKTIQAFEEIIKDSQILLMHGPLGIIELEKAQNGTLQILKILHKLQKPVLLSGAALCNFALKYKIHLNLIPDFEFIKQFLIPNSKLVKNFFSENYN